ncbi:Arginine N-methyltransferase family protein [Quillaja saponaria]|uniref:Arginine N-methyltransferase family protein n=1 Tax=Quillaja saponaria TaxID=32244 RepID=A0AAD7PC20_QUISA|nr:Arginine N-methyltransferase family protein [Quillaja saponaria]
MATQNEQAYKIDEELEEEEDEEEPQDWDGWDADGGEEDLDSDFLCLFCDSKYNLCDSLFEHCISTHYFDFHAIRKALDLDFYGSFKLINYVRSQVAEQRCWNCGLTFQSNRDLQDHLHETFDFKGIKSLWDDSRYLKPFMQDDSLLYSFGDYEEGEDDQTVSIDKEELMRDLMISEEGCIDENTAEKTVLNDSISFENGRKGGFFCFQWFSE